MARPPEEKEPPLRCWSWGSAARAATARPTKREDSEIAAKWGLPEVASRVDEDVEAALLGVDALDERFDLGWVEVVYLGWDSPAASDESDLAGKWASH